MIGATYVRGVEARETLMAGPLGAVLLLDTAATEGRFSLVEHLLPPRALGAPVHRHSNEDEYSVVLEGIIGLEIAGERSEATAGDVVVKPRGIPHAFWNATGTPARLLELIVPGGFERYFAELGEVLGGPGRPDPAALGELASRYGLELDPESIPRLAAEHGLDLGAGRPGTCTAE